MDRTAPVTLADLFGAGTLADPAAFGHDGRGYRVMDPDMPDTVIGRTGEAGGVEMAERVILRHLDAGEIGRADIVVDVLLA